MAHQIFTRHATAIKQQFIDYFSDQNSFDQYKCLASEPRFAARDTAERIAAKDKYVDRLETAIKAIADKLVLPETVPINIPSLGLSQASGVVAHCLWGDLFAMLGKCGLNPDGSVAGGTLRIPGQISAESEVQGLSRKYFLGRIPGDKAADAAARMGLPENAYQMVQEDVPPAALDYSDLSAENELFVCQGTQF